ncbi:hypothetical protein I553_5600 [Mycobacterium xenopi 4042]|uniref:Uncharacterized protein n=1 Tax=Mycobacterium xenopi 4042 TaxID=1299334 RepID=X7ZVS8_MYCXE|nr:hypothetical protein I553_5600 [Mycobacterium xenopi 4042]
MRRRDPPATMSEPVTPQHLSPGLPMLAGLKRLDDSDANTWGPG